MELTLASFLNTPWGMAVFILADIAVFGQQVKIPIYRCQTHVRNFFAQSLINGINGRMAHISLHDF